MGGQFGSAADGADSDGDVSTNYCTLATADLDDRSADASGDAALDSELCGGEVATRRSSGNGSAHNGNGNGNGIAGSRIAEATLRQWIESWISFCQKKEVTFHDYERAVESFRSVLDSHLRREELQRSLCVIEREYLGERVASSEERVAALESRRKELELQWRSPSAAPTDSRWSTRGESLSWRSSWRSRLSKLRTCERAAANWRSAKVRAVAWRAKSPS